MKDYKITCRADGVETTTIIKAENKNNALMSYLKSISDKEKIPRDYKIKIKPM